MWEESLWPKKKDSWLTLSIREISPSLLSVGNASYLPASIHSVTSAFPRKIPLINLWHHHIWPMIWRQYGDIRSAYLKPSGAVFLLSPLPYCHSVFQILDCATHHLPITTSLRIQQAPSSTCWFHSTTTCVWFSLRSAAYLLPSWAHAYRKCITSMGCHQITFSAAKLKLWMLFSFILKACRWHVCRFAHKSKPCIGYEVGVAPDQSPLLYDWCIHPLFHSFTPFLKSKISQANFSLMKPKWHHPHWPSSKCTDAKCSVWLQWADAEGVCENVHLHHVTLSRLSALHQRVKSLRCIIQRSSNSLLIACGPGIGPVCGGEVK